MSAGRDVFITRIAACLPNPPVGNEDMERILGQVGERPSRARRTVLRSNGIRSRHYAIDPETLEYTHSNASLTAEAVRGLAGEGFEPAQIQSLACGTTVADQLAPGHGLMVHGELGLPPCEVVSNAGICLAGMASMRYAWMSVLAGLHDNAVATGSELASAMLRSVNYEAENEALVQALEKRPELAFEKDFLRWMLSDGAGAVLMQPTPGPGPVSLRVDWMEMLSYAGEMETCMYAGAVKVGNGGLRGWLTLSQRERAEQSVMAIKQDVKLLNEHIVEYSVERAVRALREKHHISTDDFDWFVPHYSSGYFREKVLEGLTSAGMPIPYERWFTNLPDKGNTGSASIYIMLEELFHSGELQPGQRILCYIPESGRFSTCFMSLTVV